MNTHDTDIELPEGYTERPWGYDGPLFTEGQMRAAIRADRKSQDREDAARFRWLRDNSQIFSDFEKDGNSGWCVMRRDSSLRRVFTYNKTELVEAIDHARRVEGDGG